ncbi:MAG: hypothetical protein HY906_17170 [Deltaproteobacteria bacterium]|nr:hypothetical protein [Deltaproteobacteria bacterium]
MRRLTMRRCPAGAVPALAVLGPVLLAVVMLAATGCGGGHGGVQQDAAPLDAGDGGGGGEVAATDGPGDALPDGASDGGGGDGGQDGGGDGGTVSTQRFLSETSGGARIESASYRLEVFIAPVRPIGSTQSGSYKLQLGPGALRNAR